MIGDGGQDTSLFSRLFELSRAEKVPAQDGVLLGIGVFLEPFGYGICNGRFTGASLTGQPKDARTVRRTIISPICYVVQYLDACSGRALFTLQGLDCENSFVVGLRRGTQTIQGYFLFNRSGLVLSQET